MPEEEEDDLQGPWLNILGQVTCHRNPWDPFDEEILLESLPPWDYLELEPYEGW